MGNIRKHTKRPGMKKSLDSIALDKKKQKHFSKKTKLANKLKKSNVGQNTVSHGVIRLTNIPHGFYEEPMQRYFSQFGRVLDIKVVRSRKTAKPLGLAYVKFQYRGVARIVSQSMNGYLMFNKIMRCKYIKTAKVSEIMMFKNKFTTAKSCPGVLKHRFTVDEYNRKRTPDEDRKRQGRMAEKMMKKEKMLKAMGLNIDLNVQEDKIFIREKKSKDSNTIKVEHLTPEESKKFDQAKDELANTIKTKLEEQKENSPEEEDTESETEKEEDEEDKEAQMILEVDESEDEIVIKTPPNAVKKIKKSTKRQSTTEEPKSLFKKGKREIDAGAPTPKVTQTPKRKISNSNTPKISKQDKMSTPKNSTKKSKAATPGMKTPKMKKQLKIPKSA